MARPYLRSGPALISTAIGQGVERVKGTRSGVATFSADLRGQGGVSAIAASIAVIRAGAATLAGSATVGGAGAVVPGGQTKAAAAAVAGSGALTAAAVVVPADPGAPATFTDVASTVISGYPYTIFGNTSIDSTFADSNTDQGQSGAMTGVSSLGITGTHVGFPVANVVKGATYDSIDFTGFRIRLPDATDGTFTTFRNCRITEGAWAGNPTVYSNNHHSGGITVTAFPGHAHWINCDFVGTQAATGTFAIFVYNFTGIHHFKACNIYNANSDLFRIGGGTVQYVWYSKMGWDPDGHYDGGETNHTVHTHQWYRYCANLQMQVPENPGDGVNSIWKNGHDGYAGATLNHDRDMEECMIQSMNASGGMHFMHAWVPGSGTDTGRINYKDNYGKTFRTGLRNPSNTNNPRLTIQNSFRIDTGETLNFQTFTAPDGAPVCSVASNTSGAITISFTTGIANASYYQCRYRIRGSRFWELNNNQIWWTVSNGLTKSGLDPTKYYEFQVRAINDSGSGRMKGPWSNLAYAKANGGAAGVGLVQNLISTGATSSTLSFSFTDAPSATSHERQYSSDNGATWSSSATITSPFSVTGLSASTAYLVRVRGVSTTLGNGEWTTVSATTSAAAGVALQTIGALYEFIGNGGSDAQTATVEVPAVQTGDLMVLLVQARQVAAVTPPVDWTSEGIANVVANTGSIQVYSKVAAGNAAATTISVGFVDARSNNATQMRVVTFRGGTGDIEAFGENGKFVTAGQSTCAGVAVTTTGTNRIVCNVWGTSNAAVGTTANSAPPPSGWTEQFESAAATGYNDMMILGTIAQASAGTVAAATLSPTNPVQNYVMAAFAVF